MNKIAKGALIAGVGLCIVGTVLSAVGYFAGGRDFTYDSDTVHLVHVSDKADADENYAVMEKQQMDAFTKLNVKFENFDLDIRTSADDKYYMEYKIEKNGRENPLTWENQDGTLTLRESDVGKGGYSISFTPGILGTPIAEQRIHEVINSVILYLPTQAQLSEAELRLADGDVIAEQLLCKKLTASLTDGDILIRKAELTDADITLHDGDVNIGDSRFHGNVKIDSTDGDVFVELENGNAAKTDIFLETKDGEIDTDGLLQGKYNRKEEPSAYESKVDNAAATLRIKCRDGDIFLTETE